MSLSALQIRGLLQEDKIRRYDEMPAIIHGLRKAGIYVALAQGVFDIMHAGHVGYLREASRDLYKQGVLIVGIENDRSVTLNKGVHRPVNSADDRMIVLSEFTSIQLVFTYQDAPRYDRPQDYIDRYRDLHPHAVVVPSFDPHMELKKWQAEESGTRLATVHYQHFNSTTTMLKKLGYQE
jgi:D-beta-D-heptose 7-phosphate kinase/D-beta-D-heptose 1-phosphate adenosyltransferase